MIISRYIVIRIKQKQYLLIAFISGCYVTNHHRWVASNIPVCYVPLPVDPKSGVAPSSSLLPVPLRLVSRLFSPLNPSLDEKAIDPGLCAVLGIKS